MIHKHAKGLAALDYGCGAGRSAGSGLGNYTAGDIQRAVWTLIEDKVDNPGTPYNQARVNQIVAAAQASGEGYVPPCNGVVAVIVQPPSGKVQVIGVQAVLIPILGHCECTFHNEATADSNESPPDTDTHDEDLPKHPSLSVRKVTTDGARAQDGLAILSGEPIRWRYVVKNTGNVTLHDIVVRDSEFGDDIGTIAELGPSQTATLTKDGTSITGAYTNIATAEAAGLPQMVRATAGDTATQAISAVAQSLRATCPCRSAAASRSRLCASGYGRHAE